MSVFAYTALSKDGQRTSGTLTSDSRAMALAEMNRKGLRPVTLEEARDLDAAAKKAQSRAKVARPKKVRAKAVESFTRELGNLLSGGVSLARSLALLRREAAHPAAQQLWGTIHDDVVGGTSLADALSKHPRSFSPIYVAMVRAGEAGGFLDSVLAQIADFRTRENDIKNKVVFAMIYPVILAFIGIGVVILMVTFFVPQFNSIFSSFGANLPGLTQVVIMFSNIFRHYSLIVLGVIIAAVIAWKRVSNTPAGRRRIESALLATPLLGKTIAQFALVRFSRMLGTLIAAGVPLVASLKIAREAIGNQVLSDSVSKAIEQVQRGEPLSRSLAGNTKLFPPSSVEMIAVAEETARLDKELLRMAATSEADLDRALRLLIAVAEPLMLLSMAAFIGTIVISMLLPIFNLGDLVH